MEMEVKQNYFIIKHEWRRKLIKKDLVGSKILLLSIILISI